MRLFFRVCLLLSAFTFCTAAVAAQEQLPQTARADIDSPLSFLPDKPYSVAEYRAVPIIDQGGLLNYPRKLSLYLIQTSTNPPRPAKPPVEKIKEDDDRSEHGWIH